MVDERNQAADAARADAERRRQMQAGAAGNPQQPRDAEQARRDAEQQRDERNRRVSEDEEQRRKGQEERNKQAAEVMEKSTPWPTQEVADKMKLGIATEDDLQPPDNPEMPPLHEQHAKRDEAEKRRK